MTIEPAAITRVPLRFGLVAEIITEDDDRQPYIPPPVARDDHHEKCGCEACASLRARR